MLQRAGLAAGTLAVGGAGALGYRAYDQGVLQVGQGGAYEAWADWKQHKGLIPLVAAATLAPNPHNSRPWLFRLCFRPGRPLCRRESQHRRDRSVQA
jgi:hypothetical protein